MYTVLAVITGILVYIAFTLREIEKGLGKPHNGLPAKSPDLPVQSPSPETKLLRIIVAELHLLLRVQAAHHAHDELLSDERKETLKEWVRAHVRVIDNDLDEDFLNRGPGRPTERWN